MDATEIVWPGKLKVSTTWPFTENVCSPQLCGISDFRVFFYTLCDYYSKELATAKKICIFSLPSLVLTWFLKLPSFSVLEPHRVHSPLGG